MKQVTMTDHKFAAYLRHRGWKETIKIKTGRQAESDFTDRHGKVLAKVLYDNEQSTHRIFIPDNESIRT